MSSAILYIGNKLQKHGYNPTSIETLGERFKKDFLVIQTSSINNPILRMLDMWLSIFKNRKAIGFAVIDTYGSSAFHYAWTSSLILRVFNIPYVPILRGGELPLRKVRNKSLTSLLMKNAFASVAPSGFLALALMDPKWKKPIIVPNYIDLTNYPFLLRSNISEISILWVRSFHASYQPELAIRTLAYINQNGISAKMAMVGPNKDGSLEKCQSLAKELGIAEFIEFTGRLPKEEWIKKSVDFDVFLNTTSVDNTPVSVMEAMALGMPVVTTKVGGIPFLFEDGVEGIMVEEQSAKALGEALISMMKDGDKTEAISRAARKKAEEWDWSVVREQWLELFDSIK